MTLHIRDAATEDIDFLAAMLLEAANWRQDQQPATLQSIMNSPDLWHYLSDCFKLYFDPVGRQKPRFRLVYRIVVGAAGEQRVQPVSVGRRGDLDAYLRAARNLGRI